MDISASGILTAQGRPVWKNRVLLSLQPEAATFLKERMIDRRFLAGDVIWREDEPLTHVIFPHEGVLSIVDVVNGKAGLEKASIGNEGCLGCSLAMGSDLSPGRCVALISGYASWLAGRDLEESFANFECVRAALWLHSSSLIRQLMESVVCNARHSAQQRICRCLLRANDWVDGEPFTLTQQAMSHLLGLRRATVSEVCSQLLEMGAIHYSRASVRIIDRVKLRQHACDCHDRERATSLF